MSMTTAEVKAFFKSYVPHMPSEDEHREVSAKWLKSIRPFLYENWTTAMKRLSFPTEVVALSRREIRAIQGAGYAEKDGQQHVDAVASRLDAVIQTADWPGGCFAKLSSRSPKDWWYPNGPTRYTSGQQIVHDFACSMRIQDDITEYQWADVPCCLLLRQFHTIPPENEFRVFVKDRRIVGISQYHYDRHFPDVVVCRDGIELYVRRFVDREIEPNVPVGDFVADVWMNSFRNGHPALIELNPYGLSDPCLLTYGEMAAPGRFAVVEEPK